MSREDLHRLLARQLKRANISLDSPPTDVETWKALIKAIDGVYHQHDEDRYLLERSIELVSHEMQEKIDEGKVMKLHAGKLASIGTMASGIGHELNNPLTGIKGYTELLLMEAPPQMAKKLEAIRRLSERMGDTVSQLLKIARKPESQKLSAIPVENPIREAVELFKGHYDNAGVQILFEILDSNEYVFGNDSNILGIFQNLLSNTLDAFKNIDDFREKMIVIEIKQSGAGKNVEINFSDNAGGMPKEVLSNIFDPFYTTKKEGEGTGLGMAITKENVEEMGGSIQVMSSPGEGTQFIIKLDRVDPKSSSAGNYFPTTQMGDQEKVPQDYYRALVIDDEEYICDFLGEALKEQFEVTATTEFDEAVDFTSQNKYDIIVTDIRMPNGSGIDMAKAIRKRDEDVIIVFMSGHMGEISATHFEQFSPCHVMKKPLPGPKQLIHLFTDLLETQKKAA